MTPLRQRILGISGVATNRSIRSVVTSARLSSLLSICGRSPEQLGAEHVRRQIYSLDEKKLGPGQCRELHVCPAFSLQAHLEAG